MSGRGVIFATIVAFGIGFAIAVWLVAPSMSSRHDPIPATSTSISDAERREHAKRFFEGGPDHKVGGGQELQPKW